MKRAFIVVFDTISSQAEMTQFTEAIASHFVSKRGKENMYIIIDDGNRSAKEIYDLLTSDLNFESSFLVAGVDDFFGLFLDQSVVQWFKMHFPHLNWVE